MDANKETYRQWMLGQIQIWDAAIARIREAVDKLGGEEYREGDRLLWELDKRHGELFNNYEDLILAGGQDWDTHREAVDAAATKVQDLLYRYTL